MADFAKPYDLVSDMRERAERLRLAERDNSIRGTIAAHSITADMMAVGVLNVGSGAVTIDNGAITADKLNVNTLSAITADMGTLTAGTIQGVTYQTGPTPPRMVLTGPNGLLFDGTLSPPWVGPGANPIGMRWTTDGYTGECGFLRSYRYQLTVGGVTTTSAATKITTFSNESTDPSYAEVHLDVFDRNIVGTGGLQGWIGVDGTGYVWGSSTWHNSSDRKLKKDIVHLDGGLDAIRALKPRTFTRKQTGRTEHGFVAQEVEKIIPEAVREKGMDMLCLGDDGEVDHVTREPMKMLGEGHILAHAVGAIQELSDRLDKVETHA